MRRTRTRKRRENLNDVNFSAILDLKHAKKVLILILVILIIAFFSVIFAVLNTANDKFIIGISINNIDVSNMSKEEVKEKFNSILNTKKSEGIPVIHNNEKYTLELGLLNVNNNLNHVLDEALKVGRSGNIISDNFEIIKTFFSNRNFDLTVNFDKKNLENELLWLNGEVPDKYQPEDYYVENDKLFLSKSVTGIKVNYNMMEKEIDKYLNDYSGNIKSIPLKYEIVSANNVVVSELHDEIFVEAKDAYYEEKPFKIYPEINGVDFAVSIEEIEKILKEKNEKNEYIIPLKITKPDVTIENLEIDAFPNVLGKAEGVYDVTNYNRANNLTLAGNKINEYVLAPGEIFSYNKVLGARTVEAGYKEAAIYVSGKVVSGLGGGICQISTILYNAVLKADLEIVERKSHQFLPAYAKPGLDATVAYGSIDFKFKNNRTYPIKIKTNVLAGVAEIEIIGIKEDTDVSVVLDNKVLETIPYETKYVKNLNLEEGTTNMIQAGADGKNVETYKITKKGEKEISRELISVDKYDALDEIIEENMEEK